MAGGQRARSLLRRPWPAHVFIDPEAGKAVFRAEAEAWLAQRIGAPSSDMTYRSVLRTHVYPAIGHRQIRTIRREEIKELIAGMSRKGLSASRIAQAHLVINAVFNEAVRNKKLPAQKHTEGDHHEPGQLMRSGRCWR